MDEKITQQPNRPQSSGRWIGAAALAAVLASVCCLGPLVLAAIGISAAGLSATFEPLRPYFLAVTIVLLGGAFYLTHFRKPACAPGTACEVTDPKRTRRTQAMLWVATALVVLVALFPVYAGSLLRIAAPVDAATEGLVGSTVTLRVDGMTCDACAASIERNLRAVSGVASASVRYADGRAVVHTSSEAPPSHQALLDAVAAAGYKAQVEER
jgi:copper chaperone CopZ